MNALAQKTSGGIVVDGTILINGRQINSAMSTIAGYVHQDDLFVGSLTVKEHLTFMVRQKERLWGKGKTRSEKRLYSRNENQCLERC